MSKLAAALLVALAVPAVAQAQSSSVEIWIRAFIPDPANAGAGGGYIVQRPGSSSASIVRLRNASPSATNACFATDHRGFSTASGSSSRLETRFTLHLSADGKARVTSGPNRTTAMQTTRVDCVTGASLQQGPGSVDRDHLGNPAVADGVVQVVGQAQGRNLLSPAGQLGPSIDYSFDFQWKPATATLTGAVSFGSFPAIEVYARQPGSRWVAVLRQLPTGSPWMLGGDGLGLNFERRTATVTVPRDGT